MKKSIGIKIVKRQDIAQACAAPDVVNREDATVCKKTGCEIVGSVTDWVREWRERRRETCF